MWQGVAISIVATCHGDTSGDRRLCLLRFKCRHIFDLFRHIATGDLKWWHPLMIQRPSVAMATLVATFLCRHFPSGDSNWRCLNSFCVAICKVATSSGYGTWLNWPGINPYVAMATQVATLCSDNALFCLLVHYLNQTSHFLHKNTWDQNKPEMLNLTLLNTGTHPRIKHKETRMRYKIIPNLA